MSANQPNQEQAKTREDYKKLKHEELKKEEEPKLKSERIRVRLIPIWLRLVVLVGLIIISVIAGALVGYGALGGGKATDIFKESTWTHISDLVNKD